MPAPVFNLSLMEDFPFYEANYGPAGSPVRGGVLDPRMAWKKGKTALSLHEAARQYEIERSTASARMGGQLDLQAGVQEGGENKAIKEVLGTPYAQQGQVGGIIGKGPNRQITYGAGDVSAPYRISSTERLVPSDYQETPVVGSIWDALKQQDPNRVMKTYVQEETDRLTGHKPGPDALFDFSKGVMETYNRIFRQRRR